MTVIHKLRAGTACTNALLLWHSPATLACSCWWWAVCCLTFCRRRRRPPRHRRDRASWLAESPAACPRPASAAPGRPAQAQRTHTDRLLTAPRTTGSGAHARLATQTAWDWRRISTRSSFVIGDTYSEEEGRVEQVLDGLAERLRVDDELEEANGLA